MTRLTKSWLAVLAIASFSIAPHTAHGEMFIVKDGVPQACIVLADPATRTAKLAAEQLQAFIAKMSGATLPVQTTPADGGVNIYIGRAATSVGVTTDGLKYGAYHVRSGDNWLALAGDDAEFVPTEPYRYTKSPADSQAAYDKWTKLTGEKFGLPNSQLCMHRGKGFWSEDRIWAHDEWGSFNAVVDFLRGQGCRWYVPHEIGEVVPENKTIPLPQVNKTVKPDFPMRAPDQYNRKFGNTGATREEVLWQMRLGFHFGYDVVGRISATA